MKVLFLWAIVFIAWVLFAGGCAREASCQTNCPGWPCRTNADCDTGGGCSCSGSGTGPGVCR